MSIKHRRMSLVVTVALLTMAMGAPETQPGTAAAPVQDGPTYRPVMSDLMNMVVQPRHMKLWLAGTNGGWDYAEYERRNIGGVFRRIATAIPVYKGQQTSDYIAAFVTPQLAGLETAIKAKDGAGFRAAYGALTTGCNQCHQAMNHAMVVMQVPAADSFPDQDFGGK